MTESYRVSLLRSVRLLLPVALCTGLVLGCGGSFGDVKGKVTYKQKPLTQGSVTFWGSDGNVAQARIEDGAYAVKKVPIGLAKVSVSSIDDEKMVKHVKELSAKNRGNLEKDKKASTAGGTVNFSLIPESYGDPTKSGLSTEVKPGPNEYNIDLK